MSIVPTGMSRAPNLLRSQVSLAQITRANLDILRVQSQLATGQLINRPSDDAVRAASISVLDSMLDRSGQWQRNMDHAQSALDVLDGALGDASDKVLEAKSIASAEVNFGVTPEERASQAILVNSMIGDLFNLGNRESVAGHIFGGSTPGRTPFEEFLGGYRYVGEGAGIVTDLGLADGVPITLGANNAIGATSIRVRGTADLTPALAGTTRLADLRGGRGVGISLGKIEFSVDGGARRQIDLSGADTAQDVADRLNSELRAYEAELGESFLEGAGVSFSGASLSIDLAGAHTLEFFDIGAGVTAQDLGLTSASPTVFSEASPAGGGLSPRLTWTTPTALLSGGPLGSLTLKNAGHIRTVDLSGAETFDDIRNLIEGAGIGLRVLLNEARDGIDILNEVSTGRDNAMSIEEVPGGGMTATRLGIRTLALDTRLSDFNDGDGVGIMDGAVDPLTGNPDPAKDIDFAVRLGDGRQITVDLRPQDMVTVSTLVSRINAQALAQGVSAGDFTAGLTNGANGLAFTQNSAFAGPITVEQRNGSPAFSDLGLDEGTFDAGSATFVSADRAKVRVDNLFTQLLDLRDALAGNDTSGITLAGERLEESVGRVAEARALVGGYSQRTQDAAMRQQDRDILDQKTRSELRDLDYAEAATRFTALQTQLTAGLQVAATGSRTLLDFLG
jgi:flagellin-like hook-associated protein FlgL